MLLLWISNFITKFNNWMSTFSEIKKLISIYKTLAEIRIITHTRQLVFATDQISLFPHCVDSSQHCSH